MREVGDMRGQRLLAGISAVLVVMSVAVLTSAGVGEEGVAAWVRATARSSLVLLLAVYVARPLVQLTHAPLAKRLLAERRWIGLSFAVSHGLHAIGIAWLVVAFGLRPEPATLALGGLGYAFVVALAATSTDAARRRMGTARWTALHRTGVQYLMLVFAAIYLPMASEERAPVPLLASALILVAMTTRAVAWLRPR